MKHTIFIAVLSFLWTSCAMAESSQREILIDQVEATYVQATMFTPESPLVENFLASAKTVNPDVSNDTWLKVRTETADALSKVMTARGGVMDALFRKSLEPMSDDELRRLAELFQDPAYKKLQMSMANPLAQKQLMQAFANSGLAMIDAINTILANHGLKSVH
ncbi:MAG: hypothetical protein ACXU8A_10725 [Burkholderiaceae bacterium]